MIPAAVLAAFPPLIRDCTWVPLPPGGGLNGGRVWRGEVVGEPQFALKQWPAGFTPERVRLTHERMRSVPDEFVPRLHATLTNTHFVHLAGLYWDVTDWLPGTPALLTTPAVAKLRAAGKAVALLHCRWALTAAPVAPCEAVRRRLQLLTDWERTRFDFNGPSDVVGELERSLDVVRGALGRALAGLRRVEPIRGRHLPIHGDFWPENVLFVGDRVSAVLDFGNAGFDHPEVDVGRLLADVPAWDRATTEATVAGYNEQVPQPLSVPLIELLASTGRLGSLANWHLRLNVGSPDVGLMNAALPRIRRLVSLIRAETVN